MASTVPTPPDAAPPATSPAVALLAQILAAIQTGNGYLRRLVATKEQSLAMQARVGGKLDGEEIDKFILLWNRVCAPLPEARKGRDPVRRKRIADAIRIEQDMGRWERAIVALAKSPWHAGQNDRRWVATIDFLVRPDNREKWLEAGDNELRQGAPAATTRKQVWCAEDGCKAEALFGPGTRNVDMSDDPLCSEHWEAVHGEPVV